jgi:hypothetical protein
LNGDADEFSMSSTFAGDLRSEVKKRSRSQGERRRPPKSTGWIFIGECEHDLGARNVAKSALNIGEIAILDG